MGTFHYNKNAYQKGDEQDGQCWFDPKVRDYILDESVEVAKDLLWCGELDIIPTAVNPLSGFHSYTKSESGIIPHAKVQLESLPTPKHDPCKILYTTGAVTQRNYIERKAGQIASFHHVFGAVVVEVDQDGDWFARQLIGESGTGNFYDLEKYYTSNSVTSDTVEAVNWGDIHAASICPHVEKASWCKTNKMNMLDTLKPKYQFIHDAFSNERRNHHNLKDPLYLYKQHVNGEEDVKEEVKLTTDLMEKMGRDFSERVVVDSNHDRSLQRWIVEQDFKSDPVNAVFMLELTLAMYKSVGVDEKFHTFEHACRMVSSDMDSVRFLRQDESFKVCGDIECGQHSDTGNNGSRGTVRSYQQVGVRHNLGHSHSCCIKDGVVQAGMSGNLDQGYNKGNSSWSNSSIVTYKNGKRTIVTLKKGKWRG